MNIAEHYTNNKKQLVAVAQRGVIDNLPYVAEECVNEAYAKLLTFIDSGNKIDEGGFDGLLFRILFNCIFDSNDQELKRGMTGRQDDRLYYEIESVDTIPIEGEITLDIYRQMCLNAVLGKFKRLSVRADRILNLYFVQGYSHSEVAAALNLSEKTSRNTVYNALKKLRETR